MLKNLFYLLTVCSLLIAGCKDDDGPIGSIAVSVLNPDGLVEQATVTVNPGGASQVTGVDGQVVFDDLTPGPYTVSAVHPSFGDISASVTVVEDATAQLNLQLTGRRASSPDFRIAFPGNRFLTWFTDRDTAQVVLSFDLSARLDEFTPTISSDLDGAVTVLDRSDEGNEMRLRYELSTYGIHQMTVVVTNDDGLTDERNFEVEFRQSVPAPVFYEPELTAEGLRLSWSPYEGDDLAGYALYRVDPTFEPEGYRNELYFDNPEDTTAIISELAYGQEATFFVQIETSDRGFSPFSNRVTWREESQLYPLPGNQLTKQTQLDVASGRLYLTNREENMLYALSTDDYRQVTEIPLEGVPQSFAVNSSGDSIYVVEGTDPVRLAVIDVATFRVVRRVFNLSIFDGRADAPLYYLDDHLLLLGGGVFAPPALVDSRNGAIRQELRSFSDDRIFVTEESKNVYLHTGGPFPTLVRMTLDATGNQLQKETEVEISTGRNWRHPILFAKNTSEIFAAGRRWDALTLTEKAPDYDRFLYAVNYNGDLIAHSEGLLNAEGELVRRFLAPVNVIDRGYDPVKNVFIGLTTVFDEAGNGREALIEIPAEPE